MTFLSAITLPLVLALFHFIGPVPSDLGIQAGHLSPCPGPAHCASAVWPVADAEAALTSLAEAIDADPSATVVEREASYLHATFSSRIFGFIDDVVRYPCFLLGSAGRGEEVTRGQGRKRLYE